MFRTFEQSEPAFCPPGVMFVTVKSAALQQRADLTVFIPTPIPEGQTLPLVLLLHGVYGSHWAWAFKGGVHYTLARMVRSGAAVPMALCMPSDGLWGDGSGYIRHQNQNFERWIIEDVPAAARRACPVIGEHAPMCIGGLSMGGFGALRLAARYPEHFAAAAAHSAITEIGQFSAFVTEDLPAAAVPPQPSVLEALTDARDRLPPLRFDCGSDDALLEANRALHRGLADAHIEHTYEELPGAHDWAYWSAHIGRTLAFFSRTLSSARAGDGAAR